MMMDSNLTFTTHTGEIVTGEVLQNALYKVANDWQTAGIRQRKEDLYASHVTEKEKDDNLERDFETANRIIKGDFKSFTIWQRVNTELTGKCVALLQR